MVKLLEIFYSILLMCLQSPLPTFIRLICTSFLSILTLICKPLLSTFNRLFDFFLSHTNVELPVSVVYLRQIHLPLFLLHTDIGWPVSVVYIHQIHLHASLSHTDIGLPVCVVYTLNKFFCILFFFLIYRD